MAHSSNNSSPATAIRVQPLGGLCGAVVQGVDLAHLDDASFAVVRQSFHDHGVVFFRDQTLDPEQHIALARRFGPIDINRFFPAHGDHPEIAEVRKEPAQQQNIGGGWHTDHSYDLAPALGSMLVARQLPDNGGDTLYASMYAAWDALSGGLQQTLRGLRAVHSSRHVFGAQAAVQQSDLKDGFKNADQVSDAVHPVAIRHPDSGRTALYVNPGFTLGFEGWSDAESRPLLEFLYRHASRPEFTCRFQWTPGSVALWDNRCTWHYALNDYQGQGRLLHRITIGGVPLGAG